MKLPKQFLLSDLLKHRVRCDQGIDHGIGIIGWMHPPVHRLLGWFSKPSNLRLSRDVWRLDQLKGMGNQEVYVKGLPVTTEQSILDRIPTLFNANVLNLNGDRIGSLVDIVFDPKDGKIFHYLISRSDPRIPGSSRWRLLIDHISDQQPGVVFTHLTTLDDLPLVRSSIKQNLLKRSRNWREQIQEFSDQASDRLEGWLDEPPWEENRNRHFRNNSRSDTDPLEDWDAHFQKSKESDNLEFSDKFRYRDRPLNSLHDDEDPWI